MSGVETSAEAVSLTSLAVAGGCAAKYAAGRLEELLAGLVPADAENLLVGLDPADDAAVYRLDDERALVFTVDFFPPVVDDPADFGAIAAANALNDVFAMGGVPLLALSVAAFPEELPSRCSPRSSLRPTRSFARQARSSPAGTRSATTSRSTGSPSSARSARTAVWQKSTARPGDALFLTKPLGTGLVLHGHKRGLVGDEERDAAVGWMRTLNRSAADALRPFAPNAVTDVTGFGLIGHAHETASRSGVRIRLEADRLVPLAGALEVARAGERTGGDARNRDFVGDRVTLRDVPDELVALAFDPQTSGGLLVSLPVERAATLQAAFDGAGAPPDTHRRGRGGRGRRPRLSSASRPAAPRGCGRSPSRPRDVRVARGRLGRSAST